MTEDRWKETRGKIKDNFKFLDEGAEHIDDEGGIDIEFIEFSGPMGKMRLEYVTKPMILDRKTTYSRRIGSDVDIKYIYSEDEKSHILIVYKWDESNDSWNEMDAANFEL